MSRGISVCCEICIYLYTVIHPSSGTTASSWALALHNFCLDTMLLCMVSFQLWHWGRLAASFKPSSHLSMGLPTGQLPLNSAFRAFLGSWLRGGLCTCPAYWSLFNLMQDNRSRYLFYLWSSSLYLIFHISFSLTSPNACPFLSKEFRRSSIFFGESLQVSQPYIRTVQIKVLYNLILTNLHTIWLFITVLNE